MSTLRRPLPTVEPGPTVERSAVPAPDGPSRRTRTAVTAVVAGVLPLVLAGCGASRDAQTYQERSQADATNTALGTLAIRGLAVLPGPDEDRVLEEGSDADATIVVSTNSDTPDVLEEVTTPAAEEVEILVEGEPGRLEVPPLGSTGDRASLRLVDLTQDLREGEYVTMTLQFRDNGVIEVSVPVAISGRTDRPVYTGNEEEEPALQAPAGGHHAEEHEEDGEPGEGDLAEAELGQDTDEEAPRSEQADEPSESATDESEAPSR